MVMSDQQARLSGRKGDAGPRAVCCWRFRFLGSSERTEPIASDQSARRSGNLHRTLTAQRSARRLLPIVLFQQIGLVL